MTTQRLTSVVVAGFLLAISANAHGASSSGTVVTASVPSVGWVDGTGCAPGTPSVTSFGTVQPGSKVVTTLDCLVKFGGNNDSAMLRVYQEDQVGRAMSRDESPSMLASWAFNGSGADSSPTNNPQVLATAPNDPSYATGRPGAGQALDLDGNDHSYAANHAAYANLDVFTVDLWFRVPSLAGGSSVKFLVGKQTSDTSRNNFSLLLDRAATTIDFSLTTNAGATTRLATAPAAAYINSSWHHAAIVASGGTMRLYVDGVQRATNTYVGNIDNPTDPIRIGTLEGFGDFATGLIDDVHVRSVALSAAQILAIYNGTNGVPDYNVPTNDDWTTADKDLFGACLRSATDGAAGGGTAWTVDGGADCLPTDADAWQPIPAAAPGTKIAGATVPDLPGGATDPTVGLRFGLRTRATQTPGTYTAPLTFETIAPEL